MIQDVDETVGEVIAGFEALGVKFVTFAADDGRAVQYSVPIGIIVTTPPGNAPDWAKARIIIGGA